MTDVTLNIYAYLGGAWTDITSDVSASGVSSEWGMSSNKPTDLLAKTGQFRFSVINNDGRYTPNGASVRSADWKKGTKIKAVFTFNSQTYTRFYGSIDTIRIDAGTVGDRKVHVTVLDWMDYATKYPLNNPPIALNQRADEAITTILEGMPIQPTVTDLDTGANTFPTVFNDATLKTKAYSEFQKLALSEFGRIYHKKDKTYGDTLKFESANARTIMSQVKQVAVTDVSGYLLQENGSKILQENGSGILTESYSLQNVSVDNTMMAMDVVYGDNLINRVTVSANPTRIATDDTQIFNLDSALFLPAYGSKSFYVQFTENNSKRLVAALPPESSYPITLLHFDAVGINDVVTDESGKPFVSYDVALVTNVKKIGSSALYLDGTEAYVLGNSSDDYEFGTGDFTIEWWEYRFSATSGRATISRSGDGGFVPWTLGYSDGSNSLIYMTSNGSSWDIADGKSLGAITLSTWVHFAVVRNGSNFFAYKDGTLTDSWTSSASILASTSSLAIGKSSSSYITACIDEVRITKGLARYITSFTPDTEPYKLSGVIYSAWTNSNGTGTELTNSFTISISYGSAGASVTVANTGSVTGYLTTLKINGKIVESVSPVTDIQENADSIAEYGYSELSIDQKYQQDFTSGREKAAEILDKNRVPLVSIEKVTMNANRDEASMAYFLNTDVGDLVQIIEDQSETDAYYYINAMGWSATAGAGGAIVNYWWNISKFRDGLSPLAVEFSDLVSNYNSVDFGYVPAVAVENVPYRVWSLWFNANVMSQEGMLVTTWASSIDGGTIKGYYIRFATVSRRVEYFGFSGTSSKTWRSTSLSNTPNTWFHLLLAHDTRSIENEPVLYINGVANTMSLHTYGTSSVSGEEGTNLQINSISFPYQNAIMKDVRIYNGDVSIPSDQLAALLYAEGAYGENNKRGLLFRTFYASTNELADYTGAYLTESQKLVDDIGFAVGTPKSAPLGTSI